jgi:serine racemase
MEGTNDAADVAIAVAAGRIVATPQPHTIADGLQGRLGDLTWPIVRDFVDQVSAILYIFDTCI